MNILDFWLSMTGVVLPFAGIAEPSGWLMCYGQQVSRATYPALWSQLSLQVTGNTTSGSPTVSSASRDLTALGYSVVGFPIGGSGVPAGATILAVTSTTITLSINATAPGTGVTLDIAAYGVGDGVSTFTVPDLRGRVVAGVDNMGGTAANRLQASTTITTTAGSATATVGSAAGLVKGQTVNASTVPAGVTISSISGTTITLSSGTGVTVGTGVAARFSQVVDPQVIGNSGGVAAHQLVTAQMPSHTHQIVGTTYQNSSGAAADGLMVSGGTGTTATPASTSLVSDSQGSGNAHPNVQPTMVLNHIIKT